jgi:hypothetical protein
VCSEKTGRKPHPNSLFDLNGKIYIFSTAIVRTEANLYIYIYIFVKAQAGRNVV